MPTHERAPRSARRAARPGTPVGAQSARVAYLSAEVALDDSLPTYSGGLGVLAGDHLRAAADLGLEVVAVTLLYRQGYFHQRLDPDGRQVEEPVKWDPAEQLERLEASVEVTLEGRPVVVGAWCRRLTGITGHQVPVYFLDTDRPENAEVDRAITGALYGGDRVDRLRQEAVLGLGGWALLGALGLAELEVFHLNEGHAAFLNLARRAAGAPGRTVFTTHTPVPAGHDRFELELVTRVLGPEATRSLKAMGAVEDDELNMTLLGMDGANFVNAVSRRHREVSQRMFPAVPIYSITNGVHAGTWVGPSVGRLLDEAIPGWRLDNAQLRAASTLDPDALQEAHADAKRVLLEAIAARTGRALDPTALTIGIARRATAYKRSDLIVSDLDRLQAIAAERGPLQLVFSGKAHPADEGGKELIERIVSAERALAGRAAVVYLEEYGLALARLLCAGVDLWLNTPEKPLEASGTSGMKAALNGVPSLSILDGWWLEGHVEGVTGWSIGDDGLESNEAADAKDLYEKLEQVVAPLYYDQPGRFATVRRGALAMSGSYFNAERMVNEYLRLAYERPDPDNPSGP